MFEGRHQVPAIFLKRIGAKLEGHETLDAGLERRVDHGFLLADALDGHRCDDHVLAFERRDQSGFRVIIYKCRRL